MFAAVLTTALLAANVETFCPGNMLECADPDNICLPKSNKCDGERDCTITDSDELCCPDSNLTYCPDNFVRILGANAGMCYHVKPMDEEPVWFGEALLYCLSLNAFLVRPNSLEQVEALSDHLNITDKNVVPGYWTGFRRRDAPLDNGQLTAAVTDIRGNFAEYFDIYTQCPRISMFPDLFRYPNQPGDSPQGGALDEQCAAKRSPGKGSFLGLDSYQCDERQKHFVICEKCEELVAMPSHPDDP